MKNTHDTREGWLTEAVRTLDERLLKPRDKSMPRFRVSCGIPVGKRSHIGQCHDKVNSSDEHYEMFVCPSQDEPVRVLDILLHEMVHAVVGIEAGHKGPFRELALSLGLQGKMTATHAEPGTKLHVELSEVAQGLGPYPHKALKKAERRAKPSGWVRYRSPMEETFKVVVSGKSVETFGAPKDPWGNEMEPM